MAKNNKRANLMLVSDPIEKLKAEHDEGLKQLNILQNAATLLETEGASEEIYQDLLNSVHFINNEIRRHNEKEEAALFPVLEKYIPDGPVTVMLEEHRLLWERLESLEKILPQLQTHPKEEEVIDQIVQAACFIVQLLKDHIAKENEILYPMAQDYLSPSDWAAVERKMTSG